MADTSTPAHDGRPVVANTPTATMSTSDGRIGRTASNIVTPNTSRYR
ncbi:hypothetical protein [Actinoplanes philippinensis]|nr:hypothetical protein [Actinoplanes philippinensis]